MKIWTIQRLVSTWEWEDCRVREYYLDYDLRLVSRYMNRPVEDYRLLWRDHTQEPFKYEDNRDVKPGLVKVILLAK